MGKWLTCLPRFTLAQLQTLRSITQSVQNVPQRPSKVSIALMGDSTHILLVVCTGRRCLCQWWLSDHLIVHHQWEQSVCACSCSKVPMAPIGNLLKCLPRLTLAQLRTRSGRLQWVRATETLQISHRSLGNSRFARCLQGGGVAAEPVYVCANNCVGNVGNGVCSDGGLGAEEYRCHFGNDCNDCGWRSIGCTVSIVNSKIYSNTAVYVRAHAQKFPSPPNHPMEDSRFACCLQGGGVAIQHVSVYGTLVNSHIYSNTATYVRAHLQKFPSHC